MCIREHLDSCHLCEPDWLIITTGYTSCSHQIITSSRRLGVRNCCTRASRALLQNANIWKCHLNRSDARFKKKKKEEKREEKENIFFGQLSSILCWILRWCAHIVFRVIQGETAVEKSRVISTYYCKSITQQVPAEESPTSVHTQLDATFLCKRAVTYLNWHWTHLNVYYKSSVQHRQFAFWSLGKNQMFISCDAANRESEQLVQEFVRAGSSPDAPPAAQTN